MMPDTIKLIILIIILVTIVLGFLIAIFKQGEW